MGQLSKPAAIFLDWDGTLVDSFAFLLSAHNHVRGIIGLPPFTAETFNEYFGQPREILYKNLYGERREDAKKHFEQFVLQNHLKALKPLPGAQDVVNTIRAMGVPSGIISNKKGDFIRKEIESFGWTPYFAAIVGAGEAPQDKPAADPLLLAIALAGVDAPRESIWYVGDSETDARCAFAAGCPFIFINHNDEHSPWMQECPPAKTVKTCNKLNDFLKTWVS